MLGVRVVDISPRGVTPSVLGSAEPVRPDVDRITGAVGTPAAEPHVPLHAAGGDPMPGAGIGWAERVVVDPDPGPGPVEVVATFACADLEGSPAITVRRRPGAGAGWYVATRLDSVARAHVLRRVLADAGVAPPPELPAGVECVRRGPVTFYLNHGDRTVWIPDVPGPGVSTVPPGPGLAIPPRSAAVVREG